jgi:hypothetical protein
MTERSAEQAPVQTRPDTQDKQQENTARIPLAERLQRRISAGEERRTNGTSANGASNQTSRVLPPPPPELVEQQAREAEAREAAAREARAREVAQSQDTDTTAVQPVAPAAREESRSVPTQAPVAPPVVPGATARRTGGTRTSRAPRRARLRLSRIDPWSVMKVSFLLSIAFGIVTVVSVFMVWSVLGAAGVWDSINNTVSDTVSSGNNVSTFNITDYLGMSRVLGFTMLVSVIDVVLITAIATLGAFLYNMAASLLGGIEVTLAEDQG